MSIHEFRSRFNFCSNKGLLVGVERESHIVDSSGMPVPLAEKVLERINDRHFGYELSACQLESRTDPVQIHELKEALRSNDEIAKGALRELSLAYSNAEVAPFDMPLDVYPDPSGRYQLITRDIPTDILRAACRVIGTHIHVGMPDHDTALTVYNNVIKHTDELIALGDNSNGERISIYRMMAPDATPPAYKSWDDFYAVACQKGFDKDPRKCWTFIRISVHGTIEFRMFGTTDSIDAIVSWANRCLSLCKKAVHSQEDFGSSLSFGSGFSIL